MQYANKIELDDEYRKSTSCTLRREIEDVELQATSLFTPVTIRPAVFGPPQLKYKISRARREFGAPVCFSSRNAADAKDGHMECSSYQDRSFSLRQMERQSGVQAIPALHCSSTQTIWYGSQVAERLGNRTSNQKVAG